MGKQVIRYVSTFEQLAEVRILHDYYRSGRCADLVCAPTPETKKIQLQYGILFKAFDDGFALFLNNDRDRSSPVFNGPLEMEFELRLRNPAFLNLTNLRLETDPFYVFQNDSNRGVLLHPNTFADEVCRRDTPIDGVFGKVTLWLNHGNALFGSTDGVKEAEQHQYIIRFASRPVVWRYICYNRPDLVESSSSFQVLDLETEEIVERFHPPRIIELDSGEPAFELVSKAPIPLQERPAQVFQLAKSGADAFVKTLPAANPRQLRPDYETGHLTCDIFVRL